YAYLLLWAGCLIAVNVNGLNLFLTSTMLLVPPVVFALVSKSMAHLSRQDRSPNDMIHILPVVALALLLGWQIDSRMFTDFRDIYLLSNPIGARINEFYYKYNLYPAEVFKSLNQKMLKTGKIASGEDVTGGALKSVLLYYDYIPLESTDDVDLKITATSDSLHLENRGNSVMRISAKAFFTDPDKAIRDFEKQSDTAKLLRQLTFISLLLGFPLAVYVIAHGLISIIAGFFVSAGKASLTASALCFAVCLLMLFAFQFGRDRNISAQNLHEAISSNSWQTRVGALKIIDKKKLEINDFESYPKLLKSAHIAERYWLVRTLRHSKSSATYKDLRPFLNDPHTNVVTMALYAIGKRGGREEIDDILQIIATTDNWYIQWYAYKALRSIGWRQKN
ncbi:MAG: HEAT repeat domain-containing protein, partial [Desulfobacterales bacterium]|nr:HEAT repeat domain-containing protein [Desulfobacterales bacterium]